LNLYEVHLSRGLVFPTILNLPDFHRDKLYGELSRSACLPQARINDIYRTAMILKDDSPERGKLQMLRIPLLVLFSKS
jgi:hypothetical protein